MVLVIVDAHSKYIDAHIVNATSAPFGPASNGAAERLVQTVKAGLSKTTVRNMETRLYRFQMHYLVTPQTITGQAPAELLVGRKP